MLWREVKRTAWGFRLDFGAQPHPAFPLRRIANGLKKNYILYNAYCT